MPPLPRGQQFLTHTYRGYQLAGWYIEGSAKARIDLMKSGEVIHSTEVPAYILWNYYAHATEFIDAHLDEVTA